MTRQLEEQARKESDQKINNEQKNKNETLDANTIVEDNVITNTDNLIKIQHDHVVDNVISLLGKGLADGMVEKDKGNSERQVDAISMISLNLTESTENLKSPVAPPSKFFKDPLNPETEVKLLFIYIQQVNIENKIKFPAH